MEEKTIEAVTNPTWNTANYDEVWNERFSFFQKHGAPGSPEYKEAYKNINGFVNKLRINMNFYAFFFGVIYFLIKGMWKGALLLLGLNICIFIITLFLPNGVAGGVGAAYGILCGMAANYAYYRKEVLGEDDFNIFKGMRWI
ncbi:DUF2628 domain-containing protein [Chryseobacterium sp. CT-SW4]|uniref:DUF2628 domain-containing protein n=1 Tax=Chryseobacterium sp. SW-1 TaxID=3157343 RepID=UPI003B0123F1